MIEVSGGVDSEVFLYGVCSRNMCMRLGRHFRGSVWQDGSRTSFVADFIIALNICF